MNRETEKITPLKNKATMIAYFKHQINVDLTDVLEPKFKNSRTFLGFYLKKLSKTEQYRLLDLIYKRGLEMGSNGGLGDVIYYKKTTKNKNRRNY